jgi:hypothetical protein
MDGGKVNCSFEQLPAWHCSPIQLLDCQQAWHALLDAVRTSRGSQDGDAPTAEIVGLETELLDITGRTAGLSRPITEVSNVAESRCAAGAEVEHEDLMRSLEQAVAKVARGCARVRRLQSLAVAAAHAVSRATALLALCVGPTHAFREVNAFAPCFGRLPWGIASAIVAAADELTHAQQ